MNVLKRILRIPETYIAALLVAIAVFVSVSSTGIRDTRLQVGDQPAADVSLPIIQQFREPFKVYFKVSNPLGRDFDLRIIPDDCATALVANGKTFSLVERNGLCDYGRGFVITHEELSSLELGNEPEFEVSLINRGGNGGLDVFVEKSSSALSVALRIVSTLLLSLLTLLIARRMKSGVLVAILLAIGVALRFGFYMDLPKYDKFGHDVDGHVAYVQYISENHAIPKDDECWTCYHPPVYFVTSAAAWNVSRFLGNAEVVGLQVESLLLSVLFLLFAFRFLNEFLSGRSLKVATALVAFWPVLILVSPRIGNDQLFYLLHMICLYSGYRYVKDGCGKNLVVAAIAAALSIWTKSTGIVTVGVFLLFAASGYFVNFKSIIPTKSEMLGWIIFVLAMAGLAADKLLGESNLVGNSQSLHSGLKVGNDIGNFVYFDLKSFLAEPFTNPWKDGLGREYFLNYMFKTSLFGEFKLLDTALGRALATIISLSFLGMIAVAIRGFWKTKLQIVHWVLVLQGIAFVAALAFLRNKIPFSCSNDFRYIIPVLISFVPFVSLGINVEGASVKWKVLGYGLVFAFTVSSIILMVNAV